MQPNRNTTDRSVPLRGAPLALPEPPQRARQTILAIEEVIPVLFFSDHPAFSAEPTEVIHLEYEGVCFPEPSQTRKRAAPTPGEHSLQFKIPRRAAGHRDPHSIGAAPSIAGPSRAGRSRTLTEREVLVCWASQTLARLKNWKEDAVKNFD